MADRLQVPRSYKLFIGGAFPRSESGRSYRVEGAWVARASRKDLRDAVRVARASLDGWSGRTAFNRGQILYRVAELMEGRRGQFVDDGADEDEVAEAIDRWIWYAGWADKIHAVAGSVNPVAGPYFNLTVPEPVGVVGLVAPEEPSLLGTVSRLAPALTGGNVTVLLASEAHPRPVVTLAEVLVAADIPPGVVNLLTGSKAELVSALADHMDIDSIDLTGAPDELIAQLEQLAAGNLKRVVRAADPLAQSPYEVTAFMEMKTVWHPMGR